MGRIEISYFCIYRNDPSIIFALLVHGSENLLSFCIVSILNKFCSFMQPILVFMSKVDGSFKFSPISVNFLTEAAKVLFAIVMLLLQVCEIMFF